MHILQKIYCRTFQTAFKLALPVLPYRKPKILDSIQELPDALKDKGVSKILLVTDKMLRNNGLTKDIETVLPENGVEVVVYDGTCPNPTAENVEEAMGLFIWEECEAIVAFGGGSSIDCAKACGARLANPNKTLKQMRGILKVRRRLPLLVAIPTTAGTGSEVTLAAVITDEATHYKYPINDFPLIPRMAVLEPKVTYSLPKHLTATTGMDALTHAVEAYIGNSTTRETRRDALTATSLIFSNIETACREPENEEARRNMLQAAFLAGNAFSQSYVGYIHAVAHTLGGAYHIPHGLANSVILPNVLEEYGEAAWKKLKDLAVAAGIAEKDTDPEEAANAFIAEIRAMNKRMGIPTKLRGIQERHIPKLARRASAEANPLYPVPVLMNAKELQKFYYQVMTEENNV
ncbi:MAG: iron-containing alcohol dehydrogenase [Lachnospiraceae bacterium]|nr:iron-containing alcohol dehydrogenase [Lachnospiraceae bacterium]